MASESPSPSGRWSKIWTPSWDQWEGSRDDWSLRTGYRTSFPVLQPTALRIVVPLCRAGLANCKVRFRCRMSFTAPGQSPTPVRRPNARAVRFPDPRIPDKESRRLDLPVPRNASNANRALNSAANLRRQAVATLIDSRDRGRSGRSSSAFSLSTAAAGIVALAIIGRRSPWNPLRRIQYC